MAYSYRMKRDALDLWFSMEGAMSVDDFVAELGYPSAGCMRGWIRRDPRRDPDARLIDTVAEITPQIEALAGGNGTSLGTGGMVTKLRAARIAMDAGIDMVIANGARPELLYDIIDGKPVGTRFVGKRDDKVPT